MQVQKPKFVKSLDSKMKPSDGDWNKAKQLNKKDQLKFSTPSVKILTNLKINKQIWMPKSPVRLTPSKSSSSSNRTTCSENTLV